MYLAIAVKEVHILWLLP